jgi:hypothetical protein
VICYARLCNGIATQLPVSTTNVIKSLASGAVKQRELCRLIPSEQVNNKQKETHEDRSNTARVSSAD